MILVVASMEMRQRRIVLTEEDLHRRFQYGHLRIRNGEGDKFEDEYRELYLICIVTSPSQSITLNRSNFKKRVSYFL